MHTISGRVRYVKNDGWHVLLMGEDWTHVRRADWQGRLLHAMVIRMPSEMMRAFETAEGGEVQVQIQVLYPGVP